MKDKFTTYNTLIFLFLAVTAAITAGCVKETDDSVTQESEYICFTARMSDNATKASAMTKLSGDAGMVGYVYDQWPDEETIKDFEPWEMLEKKAFTFDGDHLSTDDNPIRWNDARSEGAKMKVFAYAPATDNNMSVSYGTEGNYTLPQITYTVPADISLHKDLVTATSEVSTDFRKNIPLTFDHILTGLKFKAGFDCTVNSITISDVASSGTYTYDAGWSGQSGTQTYTITFDGGKAVSAGEMITDDADGNVVFMIPQKFSESSTAEITLSYDNGKSISTLLKGCRWETGIMMTYTLYKTEETSYDYIYFDLAAGNVTINGDTYTGSVYINGGTDIYTFNKVAHEGSNRYYIYQSSSSNRESTGWSGAYGSSTFTLPTYNPVMYEGQLWEKWITNNTDVEGVIAAWNNENYDVATEVGREGTGNYITVSGDLECHITIDNLYSTKQHTYGADGSGTGLGFRPDQTIKNSVLTITIVGDNRFGNLRYWNGGSSYDANNNNKLIFDGSGSLTVADVDALTATNAGVTGHYGNHFNSAIGATDHGPKGSQGIIINGGTIFAGTTAAENSSAIGGGGNGIGEITINGGTVTAVAHTTGTAIGGGIGFSAQGGPGYVTINGGNVYAYNLENPHGIPSAAIGGAGSKSSTGSVGEVTISGGNIFAYSVGGTAIGGGSSKTSHGGEGKVIITGGTIAAKSVAGQVQGSNTAGASIGGGTGGSNSGVNGGSATVTISGVPIIRTGSIGGGKTNNTTGHIGSANINIHGGDIQAQFVMAAGAQIKPSFTMTGGLIRNSDTKDVDYAHIEENGGAVYLEDGSFTMSGGEIRQCYAEMGGAIYIKGSETTTFNMTGGKITECASKIHGGAVYMEGGAVIIQGGEISHNLTNNGNGGGFCIVGGNFRMPENGSASILENAAFDQNGTGGMGGGIYVTSTGNDVIVDIISGNIINNSSDRVGGGISVDMKGNDISSAMVTVGKIGGGNENPSITNNNTFILGGGLYANGANADITINSGRIADNTISGYVSNPDVANEGGMVTLNGGDVTHVTVTYDNNGNYFGGEVQTAQQKIVTSTNSLMVVPVEFKRLGYVLNGWNTRPDGRGTPYTESQVMNLSSDLTLYAQWIRD